MNITGDVSAKSYRKHLAEQGIFHTDQKLAEEIKSYIPQDVPEVYDPTCGCGALLSVFPDNVKKYGQEINEDMVEYCQANLVNANITVGDTLVTPHFINRKFPAIVANYPFSIKWDSDASYDVFTELGVPVLPQASKADFAFICHILYQLADKGTASILSSCGVAYRGGREAKLRQWLVQTKWISKVILFEGGYFEDTKVPTTLFVIQKGVCHDSITFVDHESGLSQDIPVEQVINNDCTLSVNRYVERPREVNEEDNKPIEEITNELFGISTNSFKQGCELQMMMLTEIVGHNLDPQRFTSYLLEIKDIADTYLQKITEFQERNDKNA